MIFTKKSMLSSVNTLMLQKAANNVILNQTFHNSGDCGGAVDWAITHRVTGCVFFVSEGNHGGFLLWRNVAVLDGLDEDFCHQNWDIALTLREGSRRWRIGFKVVTSFVFYQQLGRIHRKKYDCWVWLYRQTRSVGYLPSTTAYARRSPNDSSIFCDLFA